MRYDYKCNDCSNQEEWVVFEVQHSIKQQPKIICPECKGSNCERAILSTPESWTRGYGWLDKGGRRRDMNLFHLENKDPYGHMRQKGEADDLANRLRKGGKHKQTTGKVTKIVYDKADESKDVQPKNVRIRRVEYGI